MKSSVSLEVKFNPTKGLIRLSGIDALDKTSSTYLSIKDVAQIYYLTQNGILQNIIKENKCISIVPVLDNFNSVKSFLDIKTPSRRIKISRKKRQQLWMKYHGDDIKGVCYVCGDKVSVFKWEAAHVLASSLNGSNEIDNLRVSCESCNGDMKTENLYEYIKRNNLEGPGRLNIPQVLKSLPGKSRLDIGSLQPLTVEKISKLSKDDIEDLLVFYGINPYLVNLSIKNKTRIAENVFKIIFDVLNKNEQIISD